MFWVFGGVHLLIFLLHYGAKRVGGSFPTLSDFLSLLWGRFPPILLIVLYYGVALASPIAILLAVLGTYRVVKRSRTQQPKL